MTDDNKTNPMVSCWSCPLCPMIYKRRNHFDKHIISAHQLEPSEGKKILVNYFLNQIHTYIHLVSSTWRSEIPKQQYESDFIKASNLLKNEKDVKNEKPARSEFGKFAFSTRFSCQFCGEIFKKDCNFVIHLRLKHKSEPSEVLEAMIADVEHYKLDGCEYQCKICGSKFHQTSSFMRHTAHHGMTFKQYVGMTDRETLR